MTAEPTETITPADWAVQALADAMAYRLDPFKDTPPTEAMIERARQVVEGMLDLAGRKVVVMVAGSEQNARRLAEACGRTDEEAVAKALGIIDTLAI
jgi:hypothetical protein